MISFFFFCCYLVDRSILRAKTVCVVIYKICNETFDHHNYSASVRQSVCSHYHILSLRISLPWLISFKEDSVQKAELSLNSYLFGDV